MRRPVISRRRFAAAATAAGLTGLVGPARAQRRPQATAVCTDGAADATARQTAGPYYTADTPRRTSLLEAGIRGRPLVLVGRVVDTACRPLPGALLDFWQADDDGVYDNDGFRLRGHQLADADGNYRLETVKPGAYGGLFFRRTPHLHVRLQGRDTRVLTTQLYFPDEAKRNAADSIYRDSLLVDLATGPDSVLEARFYFVLARV